MTALLLAIQIDAWIRDLRSDDVAVRDRATRSLEEAGEGAIDALEAVLGDDDPEVRARVTAVLEPARVRRRLREGGFADPPPDLPRTLAFGDETALLGALDGWNIVQFDLVLAEILRPSAHRTPRDHRALMLAALDAAWHAASAHRIALSEEALGSADDYVRARAVQRLLDAGEFWWSYPRIFEHMLRISDGTLFGQDASNVAQSLLRCLDHPDADIRRQAARVAGNSATLPEILVPALRRLLDDAAARQDAAEALARSGQREALAPLLERFESVGSAARRAMIAHWPDETAEAVRRALWSDDVVLVLDVVPAAPADTLEPLQEHPDPRVRAAAARRGIGGRWDDAPEVQIALLETTRDVARALERLDDPALRAAAVRAIGRAGTPEEAARVVPLLRHTDAFDAAMEVVRARKLDAAVPVLASLAPELGVRALAELGWTRATEALLDLADRDDDAGTLARDALLARGEPALAPILRRRGWIADLATLDPHEAAAAIRPKLRAGEPLDDPMIAVLHDHPRAFGREDWIEGLAHPDPEVRHESVWNLDVSHDAVLALQSDDDADVRAAAAWNLARYAPDGLDASFDDPAPAVRAAAAEAAGQYRVRAAVSRLRAMLPDRRAAAALVRLGEMDAWESIVRDATIPESELQALVNDQPLTVADKYVPTLLGSARPFLRRQALLRARPEDAALVAERALDLDFRTRALAVSALGDAARARLADPSPAVRISVLQSVSSWTRAEIEPLMQDPSPEVRAMARRLLEEIP